MQADWPMQSAAVHFVLEHWPTMDSGQRLHMDNKRAPGTSGADGQFAHSNRVSRTTNLVFVERERERTR